MSRLLPPVSFLETQQQKMLPWLAVAIAVVGSLILGWAAGDAGAMQAAAPLDCSSGNAPAIIEVDTTLPTELYVTENVTIRNGATVTLTAGTQVTMCGAYQWWVQDARLMALGTEAEPVTFMAQDAGTPWERIYMGGGGIAVQESVLQHVVLQDGGGADDTAETGALHIYSPDLSVGTGPVLDHVTVQNSGSYGIYVRMDELDPDPLSLTNLTVSGSARAPLMLYVSAMRGLGGGQALTGNTEDVIEVRAGTVGGGTVEYDQRWLKHDVPYKVVSNFGGISLTGDHEPILTIDPGVTMLMDVGADIEVQTGGLVAEGTEDDPIIFTRPEDGAPQWERITIDNRFSEPESRLSHVQVLHAGHAEGAIFVYNGSLSISNASIRHSGGPGVRVVDGFLEIVDSDISFNDVGVEFRVGSRGVLRRNSLTNNLNGAVINDDSRGSCVDAIGNYWGSADGPADASAALDDCNLATANGGNGDAVSDNVLYEPWLTGPPGGPQDDASSISPDPFWVVADGIDSATVTVTVRDGQGNPLPGKEVTLSSTRGDIQQPAAPTNAEGVTTGVISSSETGTAIVTAHNETDDAPLAAIGAIYFWRGQGETAGMLNPGGAPYVAPQLEIDGQPFEVGFPMTFRLPMQNGNAVQASVVVTYSVSKLGVGAAFQPVETVSETLQPGEAWDAEAVWYPPSTGHRCVQALMTVTLPDGATAQPGVLAPQETVDVGPFQVNFDVPDDPCKELDVDDLIPNSAGMSGARKHFVRLLIQAYLANECINSHLGGAAAPLSPAPELADGGRDYEVIVTPPVYTPPQLEVGGDVTQARADAVNAGAEAAMRLAALDEARLETAERIRAAGQAGDDDAAARQREAYGAFHREYADQLEALADAIDALLLATEGEGTPDTTFTPAVTQSYLQEIQTNGYPTETVDFLSEAGMPQETIEIIRQAEVAQLEAQAPQTRSYYDYLRRVSGAMRRLALALRQDFVIGGVGSSAPAQTGSDDLLSATFTVGNATESAGTVDLTVRPVDVPLDWSYSLDKPAPTLDPGQTTTVTLTIDPAGGQATGRTVQLAVEGFMGSQFVGGVLIERTMPAVQYDAYLPMVLRD